MFLSRGRNIMKYKLLVKTVPMNGDYPSFKEALPREYKPEEYNPFTKAFEKMLTSGEISSIEYKKVPYNMIDDPINAKNFRFYVKWGE